MSRIGKLPIQLSPQVKVAREGDTVRIKGPKGELRQKIHRNISVDIADGNIIVKRSKDDRVSRSLHGLTRTLLYNMVKGVTEGFEKQLVITGVGYRALQQGKNLTLHLGYSHPIVYRPPDGIELVLGQQNTIIVKGIDKEKVGQVAADIRSLRRVDAYKGKGIRYADERVRLKPGKGAA